jgi:hypothetical protein
VSLHDVGETPPVFLRVRDPAGDGNTLVDADALPTATLLPPGGGAGSAVTVTHPSVGVYRADPVLSAAGAWTLRWSVILNGHAEPLDVGLLALDPDAAATDLPAWAPSTRQVADHIPTRTRPTAEWGQDDTIVGDFTPATTPTDEQAVRLIAQASAWVAAAIGAPVAAAAYRVAGVAAALRAAYWVELSFPERDGDLAVYDRLRDEANDALAVARAVNVEAGAVDPDPAGVDDLVTFAFPDPPAWADRAIF